MKFNKKNIALLVFILILAAASLILVINKRKNMPARELCGQIKVSREAGSINEIPKDQYDRDTNTLRECQKVYRSF